MTIDEAISIMNVIVHMLEPQYDTDRIEEAVEMAINALKQQPTDAVDRVTIKEYLSSYEVAQPKMGKWLIKRVVDYDHAVCSVCGDDSYLSPEWDALELYKYCPNCGSKMQEVEG